MKNGSDDGLQNCKRSKLIYKCVRYYIFMNINFKLGIYYINHLVYFCEIQ